jgi:hypothetical protein
MEMTMSVRGGERTDHCASAAAVDVTYWATEFERVYIMTAARIRCKRALIRRDIPRDRKSEPLTFSPSEEPPMTVTDFVQKYNKDVRLPASGGAFDLEAKSGFGFLQHAVSLARGDRKALVDVEVSFTYRTEVLPNEYPDVRKVVSDTLAALQRKSRKGVYWEIYAHDVAAQLFQDYDVFSSLTVRLVIHPDDLRSYLRTATATVHGNPNRGCVARRSPKFGRFPRADCIVGRSRDREPDIIQRRAIGRKGRIHARRPLENTRHGGRGRPVKRRSPHQP